MSGNGYKPWSEDDLFDLDSAFAWGGGIKEIARFLGREVPPVERKAWERDHLPMRRAGTASPSGPRRCPHASFLSPAGVMAPACALSSR